MVGRKASHLGCLLYVSLQFANAINCPSVDEDGNRLQSSQFKEDEDRTLLLRAWKCAFLFLMSIRTSVILCLQGGLATTRSQDDACPSVADLGSNAENPPSVPPTGSSESKTTSNTSSSNPPPTSAFSSAGSRRSLQKLDRSTSPHDRQQKFTIPHVPHPQPLKLPAEAPVCIPEIRQKVALADVQAEDADHRDPEEGSPLAETLRRVRRVETQLESLLTRGFSEVYAMNVGDNLI
ncbi:hypothetical protein K438DRAFT_1976082 [Mycena galopus ATCC 62051]|nr:hypothetical protein K438DRAFT_1976082 [Mycena galopus ATCC 62051]